MNIGQDDIVKTVQPEETVVGFIEEAFVEALFDLFLGWDYSFCFLLADCYDKTSVELLWDIWRIISHSESFYLHRHFRKDCVVDGYSVEH